MKKLSELNLTNDFLFKEVMNDAEICKGVLECVLGREIGRVEVLETEKSLNPIYNRRGIRLDVYAKDSNNVMYNVEMQNINHHDIPKRMRYTQSQLDTALLEEGIANYNELNDSIIIFICDFDPFGKGKYVYNFVNMEKDDNTLTLDDGTAKIFISTQGKNEVRKDLKDFLSYIKCSTSEEAEKSASRFIKNLNVRVTDIKTNRNAEVNYMVYEKLRFEAIAEGHSAGYEAGQNDGYAEGRTAGYEAGQNDGFAEGLFTALAVMKQYKNKEISAETAAEMLKISKEEFLKQI